MVESLNAEFYSNNRARLRKLFQGKAPIVITAHGQVQQGGDYAYKFHQDGSFLYLTGIDQPNIVLVIDKEKEYLILPDRSDYSDIFDGAFNPAKFAELSGINEVLDNKTGWKKLTARFRKAKHFATLAPLPAYVDSHDFYANPARANLIAKIKQINPALEALDLRQHLGVMRMVKQAPEIEAIQQAVDVTVQTFKEVRTRLAKQEYEYQVEAALSYGFRKRGSDGHAYDPIVAGGLNSCTLHYCQNNSRLNHGELVLIDAGSQVNRYAADISRTYSVSGEPSKRQKQIHSAVMEVRQFALDHLKPGITIRENEKLVEQFMGEKLRSLGLIRNVEHDEIRKYYPHATSHFLGLDVHDGGDYERALEPGVVLTVEPGIYIEEESIGIRIEDDVLITDDGNVVMSAKLPHEL